MNHPFSRIESVRQECLQNGCWSLAEMTFIRDVSRQMHQTIKAWVGIAGETDYFDADAIRIDWEQDELTESRSGAPANVSHSRDRSWPSASA